MKTLIRTLVMLGLIVWLGAEIFFPVVAQVAFTQLAPDRHAPGLIVGSLLRMLHGVGLVSGMVLLALLALGPAWGIFRAKPALAATTVVVRGRARVIISITSVTLSDCFKPVLEVELVRIC